MHKHHQEIFNSRIFLQTSWILIFLFIVVERFSELLKISQEVPKSLLLTLKYLAIITCIISAIKFNKKTSIGSQKTLLIITLLITLIAFTEIKNYSESQNYQQFFCWLYLAMNIYLIGTESELLLKILCMTNQLSLLTIFFGASAWSIDDRLAYLNISGRLAGIFGQPNVTALAAAYTAVSLMGVKTKNARINIFFAAAVLVFSASLTVISSLLIAGSATILYQKFGKKVILILHLAILVISVYFPFAVTRNQIDFATANQFTGRVGIWAWTIEKVRSPEYEPNLEIFSLLYNSDASHIYWFHAHNQFLMNWVTGGLPLAISVEILLVWIIIMLGSKKIFTIKKSSLLVLLYVNLIFEIPVTLDKFDARLLLMTFFIHKMFDAKK